MLSMTIHIAASAGHILQPGALSGACSIVALRLWRSSGRIRMARDAQVAISSVFEHIASTLLDHPCRRLHCNFKGSMCISAVGIQLAKQRHSCCHSILHTGRRPIAPTHLT